MLHIIYDRLAEKKLSGLAAAKTVKALVIKAEETSNVSKIISVYAGFDKMGTVFKLALVFFSNWFMLNELSELAIRWKRTMEQGGDNNISEC